MRRFLSIIQQFPDFHWVIEMRSLSMLYTQIHSMLERLIALATLTFFPTMEKFNPDVPNFMLLTSLIVEFDRKPIWILLLARLIRFVMFSFFLSSHTDYCSHYQSFRYWSESLVSRKVYPAKSCNSWSDFKSHRCDNNPTNYMGYDAIPSLQGVFFNEIMSDRSVVEELNNEAFYHIGSSFVERSDLTKLITKVGKNFVQH